MQINTQRSCVWHWRAKRAERAEEKLPVAKQWLTTEVTLELTGSIFPQQKSVLSEKFENVSLYVKTFTQNFLMFQKYPSNQ